MTIILISKTKIKIFMTEKEKIKQYLEAKGISKNGFYQKTGLSMGFLDSGKSLGVDKLKIIIDNFPDLPIDWVVFDRPPSDSHISNESGVVVAGENSGSIDNRHYYSDSPDVLKAQVDLLEERIKEKDAQIKEKDAQISRLLTILEKR